MKGTIKNKTCRFNCGKGFFNEHYRDKHETHCKRNPYRGNKVSFKLIKGKWVFKGKVI